MDLKYRTPTCFRCKRRKTRCDSHKPCNACSSTNAACAYDEDSTETHLRKGAACLACRLVRRKKKKCDGKMPCRTCKSSKTNNLCEYTDRVVVVDRENGVGTLDASRFPSETRVASGSSSWPSIYNTIPVATFNPPQNYIGDIHSPSPFTVSELPASEWTSPASIVELFRARDLFFEYTEERGLNAADNVVSTEDTTTEITIAFITDDSPVNFSISSPSPFFKVAGPSLDSDDDELYKIRKLFLRHHIQLGLSVSDSKLAAISEGGAGGLVHPILLHACQLLGYRYARHLKHNTWLPLPGQSEGETEQTQLGLHALQQFGMNSCPISFLQMTTLLALYYCNTGEIARSREIFARANKMALDHNLDVFLLEPPPLDKTTHFGFKRAPTTLKEEAQAVLSQILYLDMEYGFILNLPSIVDPRLYACFAALIASPNPRAEINFVRAKSLFLLSETRRLVAQWYLGEPASDEWYESYWALMEALAVHRSFVTLTLTKMAFCPEMRAMVLGMKVCAIITLTGFLEMTSLFCGEQPELRRKRCDVVMEIVSVTASFTEEDCAFLDPILLACWTETILMVDHSIHLGPEDVVQSIRLPKMASVIRQRSKSLKQVLPSSVNRVDDI
ncbi:hypothetical protein C8R44DRAFT_96184 [Mycena epipterygia]|nr:hypothetical protein C8R44DRAFT_96184 [Mycena epipterygia]